MQQLTTAYQFPYWLYPCSTGDWHSSTGAPKGCACAPPKAQHRWPRHYEQLEPQVFFRTDFYQKLKATTLSFQTLPTEKLKSYLQPQAFIKGTAGFVVVEMVCPKFTEHPWCSVANKQFY